MASNIYEFIIKAKDEASKVLSTVNTNLKNTGASLGGLNSNIKTSAQGFKDSAAQVRNVGLQFAAVGAIAAKTAKGFIDAANKQIKAETQLNSVLKATGNAAGLTAEEIKGMASRLQKVTPIGDEVILMGQNMLLTFKNIKGDTFERATESLLDMATAMNNGATPSAEQLKAQSIQLGKALNDPITGISALNRVGITFTDEQKKTIKTMQEMGDVAGAQSVILKELESQFGGSAAAQAQTFAGKMEQLSNRLGDVGEKIGVVLIKAIEAVMPTIEGVITFFEEMDDGTKDVIATVLIGATAFGAFAAALAVAAQIASVMATGLLFLVSPIGLIITAIAALTAAWVTDFMGMRTAILGFIDTILPAWDIFMEGLQSAAETAMQAVSGIFEFWTKLWEGDFAGAFDAINGVILNAFNTMATLIGTSFAFIGDIIFEALASVGLDFREQWNGVLVFTQQFFGTLIGFYQGVFTTITGVISAFLSILQGDWQGAWEKVKQVGENIWNGISNFLSLTWQNIANIASGIWNGITATITGAWEIINNATGGAIGAMVGVVGDGFNIIGGVIVGTWNTVQSVTQTVWGGIQSFFEVTLGAIQNTVQFFIDLFTGNWGGAMNGIKDTTSSIWGAITGIFTSTFEAIQGIIGSALEIITGMVEGAWTAISETTGNIIGGITGVVGDGFNAVGGAISGAASGIGDAANGVFGAITSPFSGMFGEAKSVGDDVGSGMEAGISASVARVTAKAQFLIEQTIARMKAAAQVQSPSKLTTELGQNIGMGMAIGMQKESNNVIESANKIATETLKALEVGTVTPPSIQNAAISSQITPGTLPTATINTPQAANNTNVTNSQSQNNNININISGAEGQNGQDIANQVKEALTRELQLTRTGSIR